MFNIIEISYDIMQVSTYDFSMYKDLLKLGTFTHDRVRSYLESEKHKQIYFWSNHPELCRNFSTAYRVFNSKHYPGVYWQYYWFFQSELVCTQIQRKTGRRAHLICGKHRRSVELASFDKRFNVVF